MVLNTFSIVNQPAKPNNSENSFWCHEKPPTIGFLNGFMSGIICALVLAIFNIALSILTLNYGFQNYVLLLLGVLLTLVLGVIVFLYPSILGKTWRWLLGNLVEMLPAKNRVVAVKVFLANRLTNH